MGTLDPRIDAYIAKSADFAKPILTYIRKTIHAGCPDVEETLKWGFPHFLHEGILCSMAAFKQHCAFGFWKGSLIIPPASGNGKKAPGYTEGGKDETGMGQFGKITSLADLPKEKILIGYVKKAVELNKDGVKSPTRSKPKGEAKPLEIPAYFTAALKKNKDALATFKAFSPGKQKDYVTWVTEAKTEVTRLSRLETSVQWMSEGKERNWKYLRK